MKPTKPLFLTSNETDLTALHSVVTDQSNPPDITARSLFRWEPERAEQFLQNHNPILVRITGGLDYVSWLRKFLQRAMDNNRTVVALEGRADHPKPNILASQNVGTQTARRLDTLLSEAGRKNLTRILDWLEFPETSPKDVVQQKPVQTVSTPSNSEPEILILDYRSRVLSGDDRPSARVEQILRRAGFGVTRLYMAGLRDSNSLKALNQQINNKLEPVNIQTVICFLSFSLSQPHEPHPLLDQLDAPWIQPLQIRSSKQSWGSIQSGLDPGDLVMKLLFPEFDGRIAGPPCSFRETVHSEALDTAITQQNPHEPGILRLKNQTQNLVGPTEVCTNSSSTTKTTKPKLAVILGHHPTQRGRLGNGVGLDTPASLMNILNDLTDRNLLEAELPDDSQQLFKTLVHRSVPPGDPADPPPEPLDIVSFRQYRSWLEEFPDKPRDGLEEHWGDPGTDPNSIPGQGFPIAGLRLNNLVILPQPPRGYELEQDKIYHDTSLSPPHNYVATYRWLTRIWEADSVIHLGKHGTLEWLPGRSTGLGRDDWPALLLEETPLLYPFIINDPGEGTQAKRRTSARIISHLPPPQRNTDLPEHLVNNSEPLQLGLAPDAAPEDIRSQLDLIADSDTRSGLHILGEPPEGRHRDDMVEQLLPNNNSSTVHGDGLIQEINDKLDHTTRERERLLDGLHGRKIPPGPSGSPTPNRPKLLPTGCNFYSRDTRTMPTREAWKEGKQLADRLIHRHQNQTGQFPERLAIVLWATSNMRTGGTDIAQALALMGTQPVREDSGRVTGVEPIDPKEWNHPPVDVVLRISGLFRDSFENILERLREAKNTGRKIQHHRSNYLRSRNPENEPRIFGNQPGAYGAGLLPLINQKNWSDKQDLSQVFRHWSRYSYDDGQPVEASSKLDRALTGVQAVTQNCDTREHDILDSDDYFQFHGGLSVAVEDLSESRPEVYISDTSGSNPEVRTIDEETARVFHSRIAHPVWQEAMKSHGYKGAFELSASLDYMFGYDATTESIPDQFYSQFTRDILLDSDTRAFLEDHNPWSIEEMGNRLLEANRRGLWEQPESDMIKSIREVIRQTESPREVSIQ